ncbi:DUF512 domain-containing protein [Lachnospiraceae bacterium CLA-AA-H215]|uniref:DUF512 domain-containing protein n=1 Tax=Hominifimenecus microfluidus TaxID=2885348 RepID=A0AAE3E8L5_9FIRM|nr:DUF512 domain-containing protein [Hominifimenecus microfluidus]MCC2230507.1 DUF512 domain-containing protein [Hominifimenecus microfluidus]
MSDKVHVIQETEPGSIAEELGLEPGDAILEINGQPIEDVFDYRLMCQEEYLELLVRGADGDEAIFEVEKDDDEDLGIVFENGLMDDYRSCRNKCMFCFIDQMPPGMRETLYFKDDDSRLSFLQGNYVTLTNMSESDLNRIIRYRMEPINISVHTMNPELRCRMLHNRFAGDALKKIDTLYEAGIEMNGQIVLCPGINDGEELDATIRALSCYLPVMQSLSVVPVGLTRYREGLYPLQPVSKECAAQAIDIIEKWQQKIYKEFGFHFVHASDEFYILAERELPEEERYDGYLQLDNGVGSVRLLCDEFTQALAEEKGSTETREISLATGRLAAPYLERLIRQMNEKFPHVRVHLYPIRNVFFGEEITVVGLITGQDLTAQLKEQTLGEELLISVHMLRSGENVFLDDITTDDVCEQLRVPLRVVKPGGQELLDALLGRTPDEADTEYPGYEMRE